MPKGLRSDEIKHCASCGLGILHSGAFFYETIIRTHACDREDLRRRQETIKDDEIVSKVQAVRNALVCKECWIANQSGDDDDEPDSPIQLIH
jgi:hypothetical protein